MKIRLLALLFDDLGRSYGFNGTRAMILHQVVEVRCDITTTEGIQGGATTWRLSDGIVSPSN